MTLLSVLAHQGGWDEILLVATPIALLAFILWRANKKAARLESEAAAEFEASAVDRAEETHHDDVEETQRDR